MDKTANELRQELVAAEARRRKDLPPLLPRSRFEPAQTEDDAVDAATKMIYAEREAKAKAKARAEGE